MKSLRIRDWITDAAIRLKRSKLEFGHGAASADAEAGWIAARAARLSPHRLHLHHSRQMSPHVLRCAEQLLDKRIQSRMPLAYVLKEAWLGNCRFYVDERVIVPRSPIANLLLERLDPWLSSPDSVSCGLDLCTGSGCLAILMARTFRKMMVDAVDISPDALAVARMNIARTRLQRRVRLIQSNLFKSVPKRKYDVIVCNPPYVTDASMRRLPAEYRHEPQIALRGGKDGLDLVRKIVLASPSYLSSDGLLVLEVGRNRRAFERTLPGLPAFWIDAPDESDLIAVIDAGPLRKYCERSA